MSYKRSRARNDFEDQLDLSRRELEPLYSFAQGIGSGPRVLGAYYMLAFSHLEIYIKTLVQGSLKAFDNAAPDLGDWPDPMLGYFLHKGENLVGMYRQFSASQDEAEILKALAKAARKVAEWSNGASRPVAGRAGAFLDQKQYPSPKNFPQLFWRLGVDRIWDAIGKKGRIDGRLILTSLNDLRTGVAHEGRWPPGHGLTHLDDDLKNMKKLVGALDRVVSAHFCSGAIARTVWNREMT